MTLKYTVIVISYGLNLNLCQLNIYVFGNLHTTLLSALKTHQSQSIQYQMHTILVLHLQEKETTGLS
jgi:hypothetical protein